MYSLKEFKESGKPVYVPGLEKDSRLLKGWEIENEFMLSPDYTAPPPPPPKPEIQYQCQKCGTKIPDQRHKGIVYSGGMMRTLTMCNRCVNHG